MISKQNQWKLNEKYEMAYEITAQKLNEMYKEKMKHTHLPPLVCG